MVRMCPRPFAIIPAFPARIKVTARRVEQTWIGADGAPRVNATGWATRRTTYDRHGFVVYTNQASRKARDIEANPRAKEHYPFLGSAVDYLERKRGGAT